MKIMLVDDSRTMRNVQKLTLSQLGHSEFAEACSCHDALSKMGAFRPDLVLVDWDMPDSEGMRFITELRKSDKTTPVIMMTKEAEKQLVIDAIRAGISNYIVKPFTPAQLGERISETMARASAA
ncbi:MAG: response regulator [Phycisphaerales bacterium JB039]